MSYGYSAMPPLPFPPPTIRLWIIDYLNSGHNPLMFGVYQFLLAVIYGSPRRHSDSSETFKKMKYSWRATSQSHVIDFGYEVIDDITWIWAEMRPALACRTNAINCVTVNYKTNARQTDGIDNTTFECIIFTIISREWKPPFRKYNLCASVENGIGLNIIERYPSHFSSVNNLYLS